ncbi:MAG: hypothetical protein J0M08_08055 [Bacteroidetes bacterium]|nr:hypothetical protein [Bacteroidota bacterium]
MNSFRINQLFTTILVVAILLGTSCQKSTKLLYNGQYDFAITKAIKQLKKNRKKNLDKEISVLEQAYSIANDKDRTQIEFLKKEGRPDSWDDIFNKYSCLKDRQEIVERAIPFIEKKAGRKLKIDLVNYDNELIVAKQKAAEYYYVHGSQLLERKTRVDARNAYYDFKRVKDYFSIYKDVDQKLNQARYEGTNQVLFVMKNNTGMIMPQGFEQELTKISLYELNKDWTNYNTTFDSTKFYDFGILVNLKTIDVTPELVKENTHTNSIQVEDGWQYVLDAKGNVKRDSAGNDIKVPKYTTISCMVKETKQSKRAMVSGSLDFMNLKTGQLIKTAPITAESIFEHRSGYISGDLRALKPEHKILQGSAPMPFPSSPSMILDAGQTLKNMVKDIIWNNKYVF